MRAALKLVKTDRETSRVDEVCEVRYRYPAEEEPWEISCDGYDEPTNPAAPRTYPRAYPGGSRRAS